ncbi:MULTISPECIES: hypothetical protein [unclassified Enterococcus]|uniref:hypothetical protein n=1 Tax=unclassified Enterococcus TaxID=2608891 RepID=UPI003F2496B9
MPQTTPKNFGKAVKRIYDLFPSEQQELMRVSFDSMKRYVEETGDTTGKGAERKFRTFMLLYRHWLLSEKKVPVDYFGKRFLEATTDELWEEAQKLHEWLKKKQANDRQRPSAQAV